MEVAEKEEEEEEEDDEEEKEEEEDEDEEVVASVSIMDKIWRRRRMGIWISIYVGNVFVVVVIAGGSMRRVGFHFISAVWYKITAVCGKSILFEHAEAKKKQFQVINQNCICKLIATSKLGLKPTFQKKN